MPVIDNALYDHVAGTWWEKDGFMALLRVSVNPARVLYAQEVLKKTGRDPKKLQILDVGCGGGLMSEPLAQMGGIVTGVDLSLPTLEAARAHAKGQNLSIDYRVGDAQSLPFQDASVDVAVCCDVLEHVTDMPRVMSEVSRVLRPGGLFVFDTINRTWQSKLVAIKAAQDWPPTRFIPRDMHVWDMFVRPEELSRALLKSHLLPREMTGLSPAASPFVSAFTILRRKAGLISYQRMGELLPLKKSLDMSVSYMGYAEKSHFAACAAPQQGVSASTAALNLSPEALLAEALLGESP